MATSATVKTLPGRYAKFITAVAGNALVYAGITYGATNRWVELATAAAVAVGVLAVPNTPAAPAAPAALLPLFTGYSPAGGAAEPAVPPQGRASASPPDGPVT